ncbi:hypothetical protein OS493_012001 [Desmophyllum pertusum]|uniref:Uncharacterized protein n=1 Tax=Desmophyllum pertusum TaxID=174260 RepID=A0A9X0A2T3_9CNID|nr:hypothetical protein OS493_012001 [Desmophyllum pertusum]
MDPLLKTSLLRTLGFVLLLALSPWLFVYVEHTEKENKEEKYQLLLSLYESMASKYNMTIREFNNFSNVAHEALSDPKPQWTYINAMEFVYQALTTIARAFHNLALMSSSIPPDLLQFAPKSHKPFYVLNVLPICLYFLVAGFIQSEFNLRGFVLSELIFNPLPLLLVLRLLTFC